MVLITNKQSNILQDIDSLHLFAQVVTSICRNLDEREILRNAYELLSAFDELVTLGYRENLSIGQIKTFLEMESHEERIQEIIARNKELEAKEEIKRRQKQIEVQRKEAARFQGRGTPRVPTYPTYTPPAQPTVTSTYDSYEAERNKSFSRPGALKGKGMQLGKKNKTTDMFKQVREDMGVSATEENAPLVSPTPKITSTGAPTPTPVAAMEGEAVHVTIQENISAKLSREGTLKSFNIKGGLELRISDPSLAKCRLGVSATPGPLNAQFRTHPKVDKVAFNSSKTIQLQERAPTFPIKQSVEVLRWTASTPADAQASEALPIMFTVWVNKGSDDGLSITIEYEMAKGGGGDALSNVAVIIPYQGTEPSVQSFDAVYEVTGDSLEWTIGPVDDSNPSGSFEFEAQADDDAEFFPMKVKFTRSTPYIDVDVSDVAHDFMNYVS